MELDPDACGVLAAQRFPAVRADVGTVALRCRPDVVWASPPCQCFSAAGKREGAADGRNGFPAMWAAVDRLRPTWLLVENVPGLLSHRAAICPQPERCPGCYWKRAVLPAACSRFREVHWAILNAAGWGVPQTRRRVFLACGPEPFRFPVPSHRSESRLGGLETWRSIGAALGLPAIGAGTNPHGPGREHERTERDLTDEPAPCVTAEQVGNAGPWVVSVRGTQDAVLDRPALTVRGERSTYVVLANDGGPCPTRRGCVQTQARRRLTPAETALLQAWPEVIPHLVGLTKSAAFRIVGNAVPPPVAEALGRALL